VETIGAGDTLIASMVGALSTGATLNDALYVGCRVAGAKVGQVSLS
jgi:fructose-1-phosphate kinase PfkB-like protein